MTIEFELNYYYYYYYVHIVDVLIKSTIKSTLLMVGYEMSVGYVSYIYK